MTNLPWAYKYSPKLLDDLVIDPKIVSKVTNFLESFFNKRPTKKSIFLHGPTGVGKTSLAYAAANSFDCEVVEVNSSDTRNKDSIQKIIGMATGQMSLFSKSKIILIDEVDGISGRYDRGGMPELLKIIKSSAFPFIITAMNPWDSKFSGLRKESLMIELPETNPADVFTLLKRISESEKIKYNDDSLKYIARNCGGDLRGAANDLQGSIVKGVVDDTLVRDSENVRDVTSTIPDALKTVFKSKNFELLNSAFNNFEGDFNNVMSWEEYNLPSEYGNDPKALANAYEYLSKADVFNRRIRRWQYWRYLVYINTFLSVGVGLSKTDVNTKNIKYKQSSHPLKIWMANRRNAKKKALAGKLSPKIHHSSKETIKNFQFFLHMCKNKQFLESFSEEFKLDKEEVKWLKEKSK